MSRIGFGFRFAVCATLLSAVAALAQHFGATPPGPVPSAIGNAKKIFVSNAGSDPRFYPQPFSGDSDRPYNQFYASLKAAGQFELLADPADADLVLELTLTTALSNYNWSNCFNGPVCELPTFRLVVYAPKTHIVLWTLTKQIPEIVGQKFHDNAFDNTLSALLRDFENRAGKPIIVPADLPTADPY
jgi:hypothetical protein